jgi:hypothetical protein
MQSLQRRTLVHKKERETGRSQQYAVIFIEGTWFVNLSELQQMPCTSRCRRVQRCTYTKKCMSNNAVWPPLRRYRCNKIKVHNPLSFHSRDSKEAILNLNNTLFYCGDLEEGFSFRRKKPFATTTDTLYCFEGSSVHFAQKRNEQARFPLADKTIHTQQKKGAKTAVLFRCISLLLQSAQALAKA